MPDEINEQPMPDREWTLWVCPRCDGLDGAHYEDCPHPAADPQQVKVVPKFQRDGERGGRVFAESREARLRAALREAMDALEQAWEKVATALEGSEDA